MLSVIIASHNGALVLPRTLDGYARLASGTPDWRIVVADSSSTDDTPRIIAEYAQRLPLLSVRAPAPGKNKAINAALALAEGAAVIFTDDDAIPAPDFLIQWAQALTRANEYDVFGGSVTPRFDAPPPDWLLQSRAHFAELYAAREGIAEGPIDPRGIFGPNMAVRMAVLKAGIKFDEAVGPNAGQALYAMGSETTFCLEASRRGYLTYFAPGPQVEHIVRKHQVNPDFFSARAYRLGRGAAYQGRMVRRESLPKPVIRRLARNGLAHVKLGWALARRAIARSALEKFEADWVFNFTRGFEDEGRCAPAPEAAPPLARAKPVAG